MKKKARSKAREREGKEKAPWMAHEDPKEKPRASAPEEPAQAAPSNVAPEPAKEIAPAPVLDDPTHVTGPDEATHASGTEERTEEQTDERTDERTEKRKGERAEEPPDLDVELTVATQESKRKPFDLPKPKAPPVARAIPADMDVELTIATNDLPALEGRVLQLTPATTEADAVAGLQSRVRVPKAYKMYVGGAFVRSESGRYVQTKATRGELGADAEVTNVPRGSRKDARDAVVAAKAAEAGWAARTAFNRGQILYRLAEVMESRREELVTSLVRGGVGELAAAVEVAAAVDRAVFYAGFADKYQALVASSNPVAGPHFGFSVPEPTGIVAVVAPERPALLGLVSTVLPVITTGNVVVAVAGEADPRTAVVLCECLATSDLPGGVVNVLTGQGSEIAPHLAKHREVFGFDAWTADAALRALLEREGADNVKRVKTHEPPSAAFWLDERRGQGLGWLERFLETKTVWHPVGV
jgi:hypothetical protein